MKCSTPLALLVLLQLGASYAGGGITADYRCENDEICRKRSRNPNSYCSFASAERRNGVDVGWCQGGRGNAGIVPQPPIVPAPEPTPAPEPEPAPEPTIAPRPTPIPEPRPLPSYPNYPTYPKRPNYYPDNKGTWDVICSSDAICHSNGFKYCHLSVGGYHKTGYCRGLTGGRPNPNPVPVYPINPGPGGDDKGVWDVPCNSDAICHAKGFAHCFIVARSLNKGGYCRGIKSGHGVTLPGFIIPGPAPPPPPPSPSKPSPGRSTWDYTCGHNDDCIKRGHKYCSFAAAEVRDGQPRGWCKG